MGKPKKMQVDVEGTSNKEVVERQIAQLQQRSNQGGVKKGKKKQVSTKAQKRKAKLLEKAIVAVEKVEKRMDKQTEKSIKKQIGKKAWD
ncbi:hypothetical protein K493DRAFT_319072 [Basidiobolus meristosporus CBS 931.73]|uniref:Uncharacterized protein n=1 Tax=Basidiobolus meristosporus CBS 931.73 TaxID=1314790 RepID=A0A1Y1XT94_9FUNG|nr:hypothetical protein K493DRAFT_319072 [Basidiobolus meristosporus CBS 931.73]|eukprot:ORX88962.1 hypothetical protein K493DRAFT_319072 [Basidiobolus meristosporus CBS 931.73]